jgi:hypothetical protein
MTKQDTLHLAPGTPVYCTVRAVSGWYTMSAVRPRDGYIKVRGVNTWNPPHNFSLTDGAGRSWAQVNDMGGQP